MKCDVQKQNKTKHTLEVKQALLIALAHDMGEQQRDHGRMHATRQGTSLHRFNAVGASAPPNTNKIPQWRRYSNAGQQ